MPLPLLIGTAYLPLARVEELRSEHICSAALERGRFTWSWVRVRSSLFLVGARVIAASGKALRDLSV